MYMFEEGRDVWEDLVVNDMECDLPSSPMENPGYAPVVHLPSQFSRGYKEGFMISPKVIILISLSILVERAVQLQLHDKERN